MAGIDVTGIPELKVYLAQLKGELKNASIRAQNNLAYHLRVAEQVQMTVDIDRPTKWSTGSVIYEKATDKKNARIWFADPFGHQAGLGGDDYLGVQILGGKRTRDRRSEVRLKMYGFMAEGYTWAPAKGVRLNAYGNVSGALMTKILSNLGTIDTARNTGTAPTTQYVVRTWGARNTPGIFEVINGRPGLKPILWFIKRPTYKPRYDFYGRADREFEYRWRAELEKQIDKAIR